MFSSYLIQDTTVKKKLCHIHFNRKPPNPARAPPTLVRALLGLPWDKCPLTSACLTAVFQSKRFSDFWRKVIWSRLPNWQQKTLLTNLVVEKKRAQQAYRNRKSWTSTWIKGFQPIWAAGTKKISSWRRSLQKHQPPRTESNNGRSSSGWTKTKNCSSFFKTSLC